jgi:23S rRNA pseudouridine2605 synthase
MARENSKGRDRKRTSFGKQQDAEKSFYKKKSQSGRSSKFEEKPKRSFSSGPSSGFRSDKREGGSFGERKSSSPFKKSGGFKSEGKNFEGPKRFSKPFGKREGFSRDERPKRTGRDEERSSDRKFPKPFVKREGFSRDERPKRGEGDERSASKFSKPFARKEGFKKDSFGEERPKKRFTDDNRSSKFSKPFVKRESFGKKEGGDYRKPKFSRDDFRKRGEGEEKKSFVESRIERQREDFKAEKKEKVVSGDGLIRLNKFIANSGVGSRRDADELIKMGLISVNGETVTEMGHKVKPTDDVRYEGRRLKAERPVYVLLNKPKGFITTTEDPEERNTVMQLVAGACKERIYPVGRLDRNTTGLLLLTNDGDLADKLTHPSYNAKKIYKVELDKPLSKNDFEKIKEGVRLEEGKAIVDDVAMVSDDKKTVGIEIHIGWNRIVRRIFETLGYEVEKLDRVVYAGLDKKDLGRGQWRFLKPEEVVMLKHFSKQ